MNIRLVNMTKELCRTYMQQFVLDPDLFANPGSYKPYVYDQAACDAYFDRYRQLGRIHMAVMLDAEPIGELVLKKIDQENKHCTLGISMKCDAFKNKGYGTLAEILALDHAFTKLGMETVYADTLLGNKRSQHVLEKVGFREINRNDQFVFYRCDRTHWHKPMG